jgi:hypothetical protein
MPYLPPLADHTTAQPMRSIGAIAGDISRDWINTPKGINFAAKPYLMAMLYLKDKGSVYGAEDAESVVVYFLSNASTYRTPKAAGFKKELKAHFGMK